MEEGQCFIGSYSVAKSVNDTEKWDGRYKVRVETHAELHLIDVQWSL